ncbi:MAG: type II toxin-antitoxin system mRNA interferase toxin, RelE/StbE family [Clostridiales bacterium]|nr:type II toxin-antitoxin system mRNA interferase toxin, RelE/StbE family [Clostridiales bacterium]
MEELFEVVEELVSGEVLDAKDIDHELTGNNKGCRECHIMLYHAGNHSELFK